MSNDSVTADAEPTSSGANNATVPTSRSPMPLRLIGSSVKIDTSGIITP